MKSGTAEQEQNGVTIPSNDARDVTNGFSFARKDLSRTLRREKRTDDANAEDNEGKEHQNLRNFEHEELDG